MELRNFSIDEKEDLQELITGSGYPVLLKVLDLVLSAQEKDLRGGSLQCEADEKRILYARSRFDGAEKLVRDLRVLLNGLKAPKE